MIDIIIPCKNSHKTIEKLLCSLSSQVGIEKCTVTIVNRKGDKDYSKEIEKFQSLLNINEINYSEQIKGVGGARQVALDNTKEPYVMFCDSDDLLYDNFVLQNLFNCFVENKKLHAVYGQIIELNDKKLTQIKANHFLWLHGAMYKRAFLEKYDIRFFDNSAGEDAGFNKQVKMLSDTEMIKFLDYPVYVWTDWNKENRINTKEFAFFTSKKGLIDNLIYSFKHVMKVFDSPYFKGEAAAEMCNLFLQYQTAVKENPEREEIFIEWCKPYYKEIFSLFAKNLSQQEFEYIYFENVKNYFSTKAFYLFTCDIYSFIKKLKG